MRLNIVTNLADLQTRLTKMQREQIPFATALSLTMTVNDAREAIQDEADTAFELRNRYTERGIQTNRANKRDWPRITAEVGIDEKRDYLIDHALGGKRRGDPSHGRAIPKSIKRTSGGKISKAKRPSRFLAQSKKPRRKGAKRPFIIKLSNGQELIARRQGKSRKPLDILYAFQKNVDIDQSFDFEKAGINRIRKVYDKNFGRALARAIRTAR